MSVSFKIALGVAAAVLVAAALWLMLDRQETPGPLDELVPTSSQNGFMAPPAQESQPVFEAPVESNAPAVIENDDRDGDGGPFATPTDRRRGADEPED